jgi:hypothetical protein
LALLAELPMKDFVLLTQGRCGSTLLTHALKDHSKIRMYGELLNPNPIHRAHPHSSLDKPIYDYVEPAADYLEREIYGDPLREADVLVGFKFIARQAMKPPSDAAWEYLRNKGLKVVSLWRNNLLELVVSTQQAWTTGIHQSWVKPNAKNKQPPGGKWPTIIQEPAWYESFFKFLENEKELAYQRLKDNEFYEVSYEELVTDFHGTVLRVNHFLDIPPHRPEPFTKRVLTESYLDMIPNYSSLREHFKDTPYGKYFCHEIIHEKYL